jgi:hypothetical protein
MCKVDEPMIEHLGAQGKPNPRGRLCCFECPNKTWSSLLSTSNTLTIVKNELEMSKLEPQK